MVVAVVVVVVVVVVNSGEFVSIACVLARAN